MKTSSVLPALSAALALAARAAEPPAILSEALLHYDASDAGSLTFETTDNGDGTITTNVTGWVNRGAGGTNLNASVPAGYDPPQYVDGRLDFGPAQTKRDMTFKEIPDIRTVFWVIDIAQHQHAFLLGHSQEGANVYHFHRGEKGEYFHGGHAAEGVRKGAVWNNGIRVANPAGEKIPTGERVLSFVSSENPGALRANSLTCDRNGCGTCKRYGGRKLAELLIFNRRLGDADRRAVERWLQTKWLPPGLLVAGPENGMDIGAEPAPGWTFGLTNGQTVACTATNQAFFDGVHYAIAGCALERWDADAGAWAAPETNRNAGSYGYVHGGSDGRVTWLYEPDGYRLETGVWPVGAGPAISAAADPGPTLPDGCYAKGAGVTLTATANCGFRFLRWTEGGVSIGENTELTVVMDRPRSVRAEFEGLDFVWDGGADGVWTNGGTAGWIGPGGVSTGWVNGAAAVFTNAGAVVAGIAPDGVAAFSVRFDGAAPVTLTNGTLTLIGEAKMTATNAADVILNVPIAGADGLTILHGRELAFDQFLTESDQTVFPGVTLAEIAQINGLMDGGAINQKRHPGVPCQDRALPGGGRSIQFQIADDIYTKCVKALFTDGADGVRARAVWARYLDGTGNVGRDLDRQYKKEGIIAAKPGTGDYGVAKLTAHIVKGRFVIGRPALFTGALTLERGKLEFGPVGNLGKGAFAGAIVNDGLIVAPPAEQIFTGPVSGAGRIVARGDAAPVALRHPGYLAPEWSVIATNRSFRSLPPGTCIRALTGGNSITDKDAPWQACFIEWTEEKLTFDLQRYDGGWTKCLVIEVVPLGDDIAARVAASYYRDQYNNTACVYRHDASGWNQGGIATGNGMDGYGAHDVEIEFGISRMIFRGAWNWAGAGLTVESNAVLDVDSGNGFPGRGTVAAAAGGEIRLAGVNWAGSPNPAYLRPGGILNLARGTHLYSLYGQNRDLFIEGGILRIPAEGAGSEEDSENYVYNLDVLNGGTVEGRPYRVTYYVNSFLRVRGNAPCFQKAGVRLMGDDANRTFTMDVDDVADGADLVVSGPICGSPSPKMIKTGAGTAVYSGKNSYNGATFINEGTLRFETGRALGANAAVILNGGTLDLGTGDNTQPGVGTLELRRDGAIALGEGSIAFAASTNGWAEGAALTITGDFDRRRIRFGTDGGGLTPAQLGRIRLEGRPAARLFLDGDGWLCDPPLGTVIILR